MTHWREGESGSGLLNDWEGGREEEISKRTVVGEDTRVRGNEGNKMRRHKVRVEV